MPQVDGKFYCEHDGISKEDVVEWIDERIGDIQDILPGDEGEDDDSVFKENRGSITVADLTDEMMQEFVDTWSHWLHKMDELPDTAPQRQEEALRDLYYKIKPKPNKKTKVK